MYRNFKKKAVFPILIVAFLVYGLYITKAQVLQTFLPIPESVSCIDAQYDLGLGSKDYVLQGNVQKLQHFLFENSMMYHAPTGYFGPITQDALKKYQSLRNLYPTGFFDINTRRAIAIETCNKDEIVNNKILTNTQQNPYTPPVNTNPYTPPINTNTEYKTCPDGSVIPLVQNCPINTQQNPYTPPVNTNPYTPPINTNTEYKTCPDGSVIPLVQNCPTYSSQNPTYGERTPDQQIYYRITEQMLGFNS